MVMYIFDWQQEMDNIRTKLGKLTQISWETLPNKVFHGGWYYCMAYCMPHNYVFEINFKSCLKTIISSTELYSKNTFVDCVIIISG